MKGVSSASTCSISSVLDFQKLPIRDDCDDMEISFPIEKVHKIRKLSSASSVTERVALLESLSNDCVGPLTPRQSMDDEDAADVETELVKVAPIPAINKITPPPSKERRPCDPVAKFLLSKC